MRVSAASLYSGSVLSHSKAPARVCHLHEVEKEETICCVVISILLIILCPLPLLSSSSLLLPPLLQGDKLYGRGTTDCLGHVALITELFIQLAQKKPKLKYSVVAVFIAT